MAKFATSRFDYSNISQEMKEELEDFFRHYNNAIDNLQQVLNNGITIADNFNGEVKSIEVQSGIDTVVAERGRFGAIVGSTVAIEEYTINKTNRGLTVNVKTSEGIKTTLSVLILN